MLRINYRNKVAKPIFIIGAPRSGTTLLYHILCNHRDLSYFTHNILHAGGSRRGRILGYRKELLIYIQNLIHRDRASNLPHEAPEVWSKYLGTYDYLTENDFREEMIEYYFNVINLVQFMFRRPRFVNKNPQHCTRVRILNRIFPDAKFIHIIRDGTAVAWSTFDISSKSPPTDFYFGSLRKKIFPLLDEKYNPPNLSQIQLYKLARDLLVSKAREAKAFGGDRYHEITYEDLVANSTEKVREILDFCELENYREFIEELPNMRNENAKWRNQMEKM